MSKKDPLKDDGNDCSRFYPDEREPKHKNLLKKSEILKSCKLSPGDHVTRWGLAVVYPIQIHGIVLSIAVEEKEKHSDVKVNVDSNNNIGDESSSPSDATHGSMQIVVTIADFGLTSKPNDFEQKQHRALENTTVANKLRRVEDCHEYGDNLNKKNMHDDNDFVEFSSPSKFNPANDNSSEMIGENKGMGTNSDDSHVSNEQNRRGNRLNIRTLSEEKDIKCWRKVKYNDDENDKERQQKESSRGGVFSSLFGRKEKKARSETNSARESCTRNVEVLDKINNETTEPNYRVEKQKHFWPLNRVCQHSHGSCESVSLALHSEELQQMSLPENIATHVDITSNFHQGLEKVDRDSKCHQQFSTQIGNRHNNDADDQYDRGNNNLSLSNKTTLTTAKSSIALTDEELENNLARAASTGLCGSGISFVANKWGSRKLITRNVRKEVSSECKNATLSGGGNTNSDFLRQNDAIPPRILPDSDPVPIVLARVQYLLQLGEAEIPFNDVDDENLHGDNAMQNQKTSPLPPYHILFSNSECLAVWCKTGTFSTLQTAIFLHSTTLSNAKSVTMASIAVSSTTVAKASTVTVPAAWYAGGWFGATSTSIVTTNVGLLSVAPWLIPLLAGYGVMSVGWPIYMMKRARKQWKKATQDMNDGFWEWCVGFKPEVFVTAIENWSALG